MVPGNLVPEPVHIVMVAENHLFQGNAQTVVEQAPFGLDLNLLLSKLPLTDRRIRQFLAELEARRERAKFEGPKGEPFSLPAPVPLPDYKLS
jgi:hypothetical protein